MAVKLFDYHRIYRYHGERTYEYNIWSMGRYLGTVERMPDDEKTWYVTNIAGLNSVMDFEFETRRDAAWTLLHIANGMDH